MNFLTNPLDLPVEQELILQTLEKFRAVGLNKKDLSAIQKQIPIVYPWNKNYQLYRNNYNRRFNYFPMGIIRCSSFKDVQNSLKFVKQYDLQFTLRSGGHCYLPFSLSTGIIIDMSLMDTIKVVQNSASEKCETKVKSNKFVILGPGTRLGLVVEKISKYNLSIPVGSCVNTAVGGLSLGGGISPSLIRLGGLMMDHLEEVKIVLANGQLVTANKQENSDLFFGIRGAGGDNFGIVVEFVFNPCKFCGAVIFDIEYSWDVFFQVMQLWQNFAPNTDRRLSTEIDLLSPKFTPKNELPVQFKGQFEGSLNELKILLRDFFEIQKIAQESTSQFTEIQTFAESGKFWGTTQQNYFNNNSIFWQDEMSDEVLQTFKGFLENSPFAGNSIEFNAMLGAVEDIPSNETAFPYRRSLFWNQNRGTTLNPEELQQQEIWVTELYAALSQLAPKVNNIFNTRVVPAYINAPQTDDEKILRLLSYYNNNLPKLVQVKRKYDPNNIFHFQQSIPLQLENTRDQNNLSINNNTLDLFNWCNL